MHTPHRVPLREKICYGVSDIATTFVWTVSAMYVVYFYTDVAGLMVSTVATMLLVGRFLTVLFYPVAGMLADRTCTRWGRFRPYLLWLCVPLAVAGVLAFTAPEFSLGARIVWVWGTYIVAMLLVAAVSVANNALLGVLSPDPNERTTLGAFKVFFGGIAGLTVSTAFLPMTRELKGDGAELRGWWLTMAVLGTVAVGAMLITFSGTRERVIAPRRQKTWLERDLADLFTNGSWGILMVAMFLLGIFLTIQGTAFFYHLRYYVGTQTITLPSFLPVIGGTQSWGLDRLSTAFFLSGQLASLLGVILTPFLARCVGRKVAFVSVLAVTFLSTAACQFPSPDQPGLLFGLRILTSIAGGSALFVLMLAMVADIADDAEWRLGRGAIGLIYGASLSVQMLGFALGGALVPILLSHIGFEAWSGGQQSPETLNGLRLIIGIVPAAVVALAAVVACFYPLGNERMAETAAVMEARREGKLPPARPC